MRDFQKRLSDGFYALVSLPATAMGLALSVQISALSWLLSTKYNLDIHEIGIVWAAGPLAGIFGQVIVGLVSDRVWFWGGRRRPFIFIGGVLAALMLILLPRIGDISHAVERAFQWHVLVGVATVVALTLDLSINVSFNPTRSLIADVTPEGDARTKGFTWMQTISGFWGVMAYVVGATLGNETLIQVGAGVVLLFSVVPLLFITEPRTLESVTPQESAAAEGDPTDWLQLWKIWIAHGFSWIGIQTMFVYVFAFVQQKLVAPGMSSPDAADRSGQIISISFAVLNTVGFLVPSLLLDPLARRVGRVKTHVGAVAMMSAGYFAIATFAKTAPTLYVLMAIVGVGWGAVVSLPFAIMSEEVKKGRMGLFMGIFNLSVVLPQLVVSLVLGRVVQNAMDKNIIFLISAGSLAVSAVCWTLVRDQSKIVDKKEGVAVPTH